MKLMCWREVAHDEILWYVSMRFANALVVPCNLMVQRLGRSDEMVWWLHTMRGLTHRLTVGQKSNTCDGMSLT